ncbi:zinc finger CCHC domain-containing protein 14 isoform X1 [Acipenser oxyrinchus oxyrinchus]|uniref:Zinc finger CCHC domain-containing protein 14 isoform X1 n=1 Tax=Acipenser oxyrinchus oxyrinchus TaxID=40147 RepID=A0AAD8D8Z8_ACIOX|nr:zinc finger CCHC domain-containing protein 14 isoform X1 [Acipenser oxyrinchus oxyrinchus]
MVEKRCLVQREGVYRWFSELNSAQRVEFLCGLLDLCVPIELRFLGCSLEDLARKDYHSLRDAEVKANNAADLATLTNITDEVVRSKLLVALALLNSDNREAAGVLFRTLTHIDSIINNYGLQLNDGQTGDQFLLLFTMASNHPAFSFHQKQVLRQELTQIQSIVNTTCNNANLTTTNTVTVATFTTTTTFSNCTDFHCCRKVSHRDESAMSGDSVNSLENAIQALAHSSEESSLMGPAGKHTRANIERIELKGLPNKKSEKATDCSFEVSQLLPDEAVGNFIPLPDDLDSAYLEERNHTGLEPDPRYLASLPSHVLKNDQVKQFFSPFSVTQSVQNLNPVCTSQHKVTPSTAVRPICGVASIQSTHCSNSSTLQSSPPSFTPPFPPSQTVENISPLMITTNTTSPVLQPSQEQNGILDWLRKLRLHKYYPVFKQLTMEKFLALTEEDLNKYDLTQGAKKKLKTQLELQKEKAEKRCVLTPFQVPSSGVARVPPTSHVGPVHPIQTSTGTELRVEVEPGPHPFPRDNSSSSGYSSSPSSPMGIQTRDETFESLEDGNRRTEPVLECSDKEKPTVPNQFIAACAARPTAQVLPVQNDTGANSSPPHHPLPVPVPVLPTLSSSTPPNRMLSTVRKAERGGSRLPLSPVLSPLYLEERMKTLQVSSGPGSSIKIEKRFPSVNLEMSPMENSTVPAGLVNFGRRTKIGLDADPRPAQQPGLIIETSTATTATSNTVYHVSHPPLKLQVSPSLPANASLTGPTVYTSGMPIKSVPPAVINSRTLPYSANTKVAFSAVSSVPMATVPGTYCVNSGTSPSNSHAPGSSPTLSSIAENSCYSNSSTGSGISNQNSQQQGCVCSSCGCNGNCGSYSAMPANYASYFQHPFSGPSMITLPFLHFSPLCNNGYISPQQYNTTTGFSYPMVPPPMYNSSLTPDSMLSSQSGFVMPPMQNFIAGAAGVYQAQGITGGTSGAGQKKNGNVSCYNCGVSGHRAQDCKQPSMDSNQQGSFRLKYAPAPESVDSAD